MTGARFEACRFAAGLLGLFLVTLAASLLAHPGRFDITDGQTRYAVAESLHDHGDSVVRDPRAMFGVFRGKNGDEYSTYRAPHSVLGAAAVAAADATGPASEARRHMFFFALSGLAGSLTAVLLAVWFRHLGSGRREALLWGAAGFFCTPVWYYSTSTFDDIFGAVTLVAAFVLALSRPGVGSAVALGVLFGLAFQWKQPLVVFSLPVLVWTWEQRRTAAGGAVAVGVVLLGMAVGVALDKLYQTAKFPDGVPAVFSRIPIEIRVFNPTPLPGLVSLLISPGCGILWYSPASILSAAGFLEQRGGRRLFSAALVLSAAVFVTFISWLSFFKGDVGWGPRYLTPLVAVAWMFAPLGVPKVGPVWTRRLLVGGFAVQLLGLSADPHRLYAVNDLGGGFYMESPWGYFHVRAAHLPNRPVEVLLIASDAGNASGPVVPDSPTYGFPLEVWPIAEYMMPYKAANAFRPWWAWMPYLPPAERPFRLPETALSFLAVLGTGAVLFRFGTRPADPASCFGRHRDLS